MTALALLNAVQAAQKLALAGNPGLAAAVARLRSLFPPEFAPLLHQVSQATVVSEHGQQRRRMMTLLNRAFLGHNKVAGGGSLQVSENGTRRETMVELIAHSKNHLGQRQGLIDHLEAVAADTCAFSAAFCPPGLARYLGLWHDVGKFGPAFQEYLRIAEAEPNKKHRGPDHKAAGAAIAGEYALDGLKLLIQGHHGGLQYPAGFQQWYGEKRPAAGEALTIARQVCPDLWPDNPPVFPNHRNVFEAEFFLRMLFSALVDADFLDTERHFAPETAQRRGGDVGIDELWRRYAAYREMRFAAVDDTAINRLRGELYELGIAAAGQAPGFFRLPLPTGSGKTLLGMGFALRHAQEHGLKRIIVAVPYLTITQQTTKVYREIFEQATDAHSPVLEHHSAAGEQGADDPDGDERDVWRRLAAQNWDAPIVVTTTVQLFESLFANGTSRCRKLHNLAESVIILDEAQTLPIPLLDPILDGLQELCSHYRTSVVLSTATQPAYEVLSIFSRVQARDIVPEPQRYFAAFKRVGYEWRQATPLSWPQVAELVVAEPQVLAIVNTKQAALDLLDALGDPEALHLSTLLCGKHRQAVIDEVKRRLKDGLPCRLVTTQVVEAGVDLDFPVVMRAMGPLDSIVQAAGRANREGKLDLGRVIVFEPEEHKLPGPDYKRAAAITQEVLGLGNDDLNDPAVTHEYFRRLYALSETDGKQVQPARKRLNYPETARLFRMIDDDTVSVIVAYGDDEDQRRIEAAWTALEQRMGSPRETMRRLQPYMVSLYRYQAEQFKRQGWIHASVTVPDVGLWIGKYDPVRGLVAEIDPDRLVF